MMLKEYKYIELEVNSQESLNQSCRINLKKIEKKTVVNSYNDEVDFIVKSNQSCSINLQKLIKNTTSNHKLAFTWGLLHHSLHHLSPHKVPVLPHYQNLAPLHFVLPHALLLLDVLQSALQHYQDVL